jgi:hypothetical protein
LPIIVNHLQAFSSSSNLSEDKPQYPRRSRLILRLDDRNATASIAISNLSSPGSLARAEQDIFAFTDTVASETTVALVGNKADLDGACWVAVAERNRHKVLAIFRWIAHSNRFTSVSFPAFGICRVPSKTGNVNSSQTFYVYGRKEIQSPTRFETKKPDAQHGSVAEHS